MIATHPYKVQVCQSRRLGTYKRNIFEYTMPDNHDQPSRKSPPGCVLHRVLCTLLPTADYGELFQRIPRYNCIRFESARKGLRDIHVFSRGPKVKWRWKC